MRIEITKRARDDEIVVTRSDGSSVRTTFPKKGPVPHDAVHLFVEEELQLERGFWGMVASGHDPEEIQEIARAGGHASAKRMGAPDAAIVELLQAERIVECFEADLWGGCGAAADLIAVAATACEASLVPLPEIDEAAVDRIRARLGAFAREWIAAPQGYCAALVWE